MDTSTRSDIKELTYDELVSWLDSHGIAPYRAGQIHKWIYLRQADNFDQMTDIGKALRHKLTRHFRIDRLQLVNLETSRDGSRKYLFALRDGRHMESVLIPEKDHYTLCVSSQVGCAQGCLFCLTAASGFQRNLTAGEIIAQVRDIQNIVSGEKRLTNIVFMGMGEPLANYHNLVHALATITDADHGLKIARRRVTVSTAGVAPRIVDLGNDTKIKLAVSLNATDNETRNRLMPINRRYPIEAVLEACRQYRLQPGHRITFEYILIKGVNDSPQNARQLVQLLNPLKAKVNLIPFNTYAGCPYQRPDAATIDHFQDILRQKYVTVMVRKSKGQDISAACGQLYARHLDADPLPPT